jgi:ABC-type branched-subunit amino acid transport system ATPase component
MSQLFHLGEGCQDTRTQDANGSILSVEGLVVEFHTSRGVVRAVDGVSWSVRAGETLALVGESGCGKSVSALAVMRLLAKPAGRIAAGRIMFQGQDLLTLSEAEMRERRRLARGLDGPAPPPPAWSATATDMGAVLIHQFAATTSAASTTPPAVSARPPLP